MASVAKRVIEIYTCLYAVQTPEARRSTHERVGILGRDISPGNPYWSPSWVKSRQVAGLHDKHIVYVLGWTSDGRQGRWEIRDKTSEVEPLPAVPLCPFHKESKEGRIVGIAPYDGSNSVASLLLAAERLDDIVVVAVMQEILDECVVHLEDGSLRFTELPTKAFLEMIAVVALHRPGLLTKREFKDKLHFFTESNQPVSFGQCTAQSHVAHQGDLQAMLIANQVLARATSAPLEVLDFFKHAKVLPSSSTVPAWEMSSVTVHDKGYKGIKGYGSWVFLLNADAALVNGGFGHLDDGWTANGLSKDASVVAMTLGVGKSSYHNERFRIKRRAALSTTFEAALTTLAVNAPGECTDYAQFYAQLQADGANSDALRIQYNYDEVWCAAAPATSLIGVFFKYDTVDQEEIDKVEEGIRQLELPHVVEMRFFHEGGDDTTLYKLV